MLSGDEILKQIKDGNLLIEPFTKENLAPNSYIVHLADELVVYENDILEVAKPNEIRRIKIPKEGYILRPGELYLGRTVEYTETNNYVPMLNGRLSIASLGIMIHITAGFGDNGFKGTWTLEIMVVKPVRIYAGMKIGHLCYFPLVGNDSIKYNGKYLGQIEATPSKIYSDRSVGNF